MSNHRFGEDELECELSVGEQKFADKGILQIRTPRTGMHSFEVALKSAGSGESTLVCRDTALGTWNSRDRELSLDFSRISLVSASTIEPRFRTLAYSGSGCVTLRER